MRSRTTGRSRPGAVGPGGSWPAGPFGAQGTWTVGVADRKGLKVATRACRPGRCSGADGPQGSLDPPAQLAMGRRVYRVDGAQGPMGPAGPRATSAP